MARKPTLTDAAISSIPIGADAPEPEIVISNFDTIPGAPPPGTEAAMARAAAEAERIAERLRAMSGPTDTSIPPNPETVAADEAEAKARFEEAVDREIERRRAFVMPSLPAWAVCTTASADEIDGLVGLTFVSEDGEAARLRLTPDIMRAMADAGLGIANALDPDPSIMAATPFKLLRQESFIDDQKRHRVWLAGEVVTNRSEIALLESRGVPMIQVSPV